MSRQPIFNKLIITDSFQLSLHAANANSQGTVCTINMPPFFFIMVDYIPLPLKPRLHGGFFACDFLKSSTKCDGYTRDNLTRQKIFY